jgi:hypothetical protein
MNAALVRLLLAIVLLCIAPPSFAQGTPAADASGAAGKVELAEGDVRFFDRNQRLRRPRVGDAIHEGESIATGADGEVHLRMEDGGYIAVRPGTRMRITTFRAEGGAEDRSVIGLLEGTFRSVTGWIAKLGPQRAVIRTPTATIGIRGTEHEPLVIPEGSPRGEPGTYDRVHVGETEIRTKQGAVSVRPNQAGFVSHRGAQRPRVLERIPDHYRPTRHEARFSGLHGRVHQQLDQRRDERRKVIEERRKVLTERRGEAKGKADKGKSADKGFKADKAAKGADKEQRKQLERRQFREEQKRKADERKRERQEQRKSDEKKREREDPRKADRRERLKGDR